MLMRVRLATAAALVVVGAAATPAVAATAHPWLGIYDCTTLPASGFSFDMYAGSARLMSHGRYQFALDRVAGHLKQPTAGRYKVQGRTISFLTGTFHRGHWYGEWFGRTSLRPDGYFAVNRDRDHVWTGETCAPTRYR